MIMQSPVSTRVVQWWPTYALTAQHATQMKLQVATVDTDCGHDDYNDVDTDSGLFVQRHTSSGRSFAYFVSVAAFYEHCWGPGTTRTTRNYFEDTPGESLQKPRFDIDMSMTSSEGAILSSPAILRSPQAVLDDLLYAIMGYMASVGDAIDLATDVAVYTSHGATKASFHVVMPNHHHCNHREAKRFHELITNRMSSRYSPFVDPAVYSRFQLFRILGSTKHGLTVARTKVVLTRARIGGASGSEVRWAPDAEGLPDTIPSINALGRSLLTAVSTPSSRWLPLDMLDDLSTTTLTTPISIAAMNPTMAQRVQEALVKAIAAIPPHYEYADIQPSADEGIHRVERVDSGYCEACDRIHGTDSKGDNAFMTIDMRPGNMIGAIYLRCHRAPKRGLLLATIDTPGLSGLLSTSPQDDEEVPIIQARDDLLDALGLNHDEPTTTQPVVHVIGTINAPAPRIDPLASKRTLRSTEDMDMDYLTTLLAESTIYSSVKPIRASGKAKPKTGSHRVPHDQEALYRLLNPFMEPP